MTKEEYNKHLKRYYKAMKWFESKPAEEQVNKFYGNFLELLSTLNKGIEELRPNEAEIMQGFKM